MERHLGAFSEGIYNISVIDLFEMIFSASLEELIVHGLRALNETLPSESELSNKVSSLAT